MSPTAKIGRWVEAPVDQTKEHFELCYGSPKSDSARWPAVALVGPPVDGTVNVQIVLPHGYGSRNQIIFKVLKQIEYYLLDKGEENPWGYAQHHSGSLANCYSDVHWSFIKPEVASQIEPVPRLKRAIILEVGGEGGSIALLANQDSEGNWNRFWLSTNEIAAIEALSDDDLAALNLRQGRHLVVANIAEAMLLLDHYQWFRLMPLHVRPEFRKLVLQEVRLRGGLAEAKRWGAYIRE